MIKKVFALASVTALTGLASMTTSIGCSSSSADPVGGDSGADAPTTKPVREAGIGEPDPDPDPDPGPCVDTTSIDATKFPYTTALSSPGACTTAELNALSAYFKTKVDADEDVLVSEWSKEVGASCAACVFSDGTGATWTPIITKDDKLDNVNRGGCIEIQSGKEACGRSYQQVTECRLEACLTKCKTQDEFTSCLGEAEAIFTGPCKDAYDAMTKDCGSNLGAYETACKGTNWTFEGPIKVQCITGSGGKTDAGDGG